MFQAEIIKFLNSKLIFSCQSWFKGFPILSLSFIPFFQETLSLSLGVKILTLKTQKQHFLRLCLVTNVKCAKTTTTDISMEKHPTISMNL